MCGDVEMCGEKKRKGGTHSGWGQRKWRGTWWLRAKEEEGCSGWGQRRGRTVVVGGGGNMKGEEERRKQEGEEKRKEKCEEGGGNMRVCGE